MRWLPGPGAIPLSGTFTKVMLQMSETSSVIRVAAARCAGEKVLKFGIPPRCGQFWV